MNEKETFLFMADGHVRGRTWTNSMVLQGDAYAALGRLAELSAHTETIVIGGDWFDSNRPSSRDVDATVACLSRFARAYYIKGNHDNADPAWLGGIVPSARHLTEVPEELHPGVYICGQDWMASREESLAGLRRIAANAAGLSNCHRLYVVLHDAIQELLGYDGTYLCSAGELAEIFSAAAAERVDFLVGHVHVSRSLLLNDRMQLFSPGCMYPDAADRMQARCGALLFGQRGDSVADMPLDVRTYVRADYTDDDGLRAACRDAVEQSRNAHLPLPPAVLVNVADENTTVRTRDYPEVSMMVVRNGQPSDRPEETQSPSTQAESMLQAIQEAASYDSTVRDMAVALYECDDPLAEIDKWLTHWGAVRA